MAKVYIGCSGFMYNDWRGTFYPEKLPKNKWFNFYQGVFDTVELNVTFYRLPKTTTFIKWHDESPDEFKFSIKGSRFITHIKRFKEIEEPVNRFFESASCLKDKLSVVLWQLPPNFKYDKKRLNNFILNLEKFRARHVLEFRHQSWITEEVFKLLKDKGLASCIADWPVFNSELPETTDFVYIRRHGHEGRYNTCYTEDELTIDAKMIMDYVSKGLDVYIYFDNDAKGFAPKNAKKLTEFLSL